MSTQYRLVQSGKTASGGCSAGQGSSEPVAPRIYYLFYLPSALTVINDVSCIYVVRMILGVNTNYFLK
jgi:carbohydrate-binding DOMON domain-containing protein